MENSGQNTSLNGIFHTRRSFIKYTSLSLGAVVMSTPSLVRGGMSGEKATTQFGAWFPPEAAARRFQSPGQSSVFIRQLVSILGPTVLPFVTINELTTVAAGSAFAQFATEGVVMGDPSGLQIAAGMNDNLVEPATGASSSVITLPPNADQTNSWRSTHALANLLVLFVQNNGAAIDQFYALATPPGGNAPMNLLQALSNIAR